MLRRLLIVPLILAALAPTWMHAQEEAARPVVVPDLGDEAVRARWMEYVLPRAEETAWLELGWGSQLHAALGRARDAGKPVLFWAMNGHPLGCV